MDETRKPDLASRLDAHFVTLRTPSLRQTLRRNAGNWQLYAAVTGSAMAMVTGASAAIIGSGTRDIKAESIASVLAAKQLASSKNMPWTSVVRLAMARQGFGGRPANGAGVKMNQATGRAPAISPGGIVPLDSQTGIIQPGEWVSIYGANLASGTAIWNGDFSTSLGGTSVEIDGKAAYIEYVSPDQINLQAPDDTATGTVSVVVTTAAGSATSTVTLGEFAPSFPLLDATHVAGIIVRTNGSGAYGGGTYDILGPTGRSLGYATVAAKAGDIVELFAVGLGPTTPAVPAGQPFSGAAPTKNPITLYINNIVVQTTFVGLSSAGLYQINLMVPPGLGQGDVPLQALAGGMQTQPGVVFSLQGVTPVNPNTGTGTAGVGIGGTYVPPGFTSNPGTGVPPVGGTAVGTSGGTGGGDARRHKKKAPYHPKLRFDP